MTTLEAVESTESLAAVAYLLNLVMKRYVILPFHFIKEHKFDLCSSTVELYIRNGIPQHPEVLQEHLY